MKSERAVIKSLSFEELQEWLQVRGHSAWRAGQIWQWLYQKWADDFSAMRNLPRDLRAELAETFVCSSAECKEEAVSRDGTRKYILQLSDGELIETVLIPAEKRRTVCVSTQAGCPVGCVFCATGRQPFKRSLQAVEIFEQILFCCRKLGRRITNVVVMGMGEPLLNLDSTVAVLEFACRPDVLDLSARSITVSTSGIPSGIRQLAERGRQWNLSWSLHGADDRIRRRLIPDRYRYPIDEIMAACQYYRRQTGRKVTIEYTLLERCNDRKEDGEKVAALARQSDAKVNLICYNPTGTVHRAASKDRRQRFLHFLRRSGVTATVRQSRGQDIQAACGQLRGGVESGGHGAGRQSS